MAKYFLVEPRIKQSLSELNDLAILLAEKWPGLNIVVANPGTLQITIIDSDAGAVYLPDPDESITITANEDLDIGQAEDNSGSH